MQSTPVVFSDYARQMRRRIDEALVRYSDYGPDCPEVLGQAIRHSLLAPGKRLRPLLVLMACQACGSDPWKALPAACAVEMVHTYSLIHDDLPAMDDDDLRRGRPSCHVEFGEAMAILAGDALLAQALEIVASEIQPPATAARCCAELARAAGPTRLVGGQVDDLSAEFSAPDRAVLEHIHRRKTGALFCVSLRLGALVAGGDGGQLEALDAYGRHMGLAFQIVDDLLDLRGDQSTLGKRTGKDAAQGKLTFPAVVGVEASQRRAEQLIHEACQQLECFGARAEGLRALARHVLERNR